MAKVLVIDDDVELLHVVGMMLERGGHTPLLENDPTRGVERIRLEEPDMLVLDVMMPVLNGHDLCTRIRANREISALPILILTARAQRIDREAAFACGADDYMRKPVLPRALLERIDTLLASPPERNGRDHSLVVSLFSMRGGVGRTTLAVNLAGAVRRSSQAEVAIVDLSPSGGQAAMHLRLRTRASWGSLPPAAELTWPMLEEALLVHQTGLQLLAAPRQPQLPLEPAGELVEAVLNILRKQMRFVVLDLPPIFNPAVQVALAESDLVMHVLAPEVVAVQTMLQSNALLRNKEIPVQEKVHIMNQTTPVAHLPEAAVRKALKARPAFEVGYDPNQGRALAQGIPLALTPVESPLATACREMAHSLWEQLLARLEETETGKSGGGRQQRATA